MSSADPRKKIVDALKEHPEGLTLISLAESSGIHRHTARKYVDELLEDRVVFQRSVGIAKLCYLSENHAKQNVGKRLLERLFWSRKGTASKIKLLAIMTLVAFLLSGSLMLASQNTSLISGNSLSVVSSINTSSLASGTDLNESLSINLTSNVSSDENDVFSETGLSTEKNQNETNSSVDILNDSMQGFNESQESTGLGKETQNEPPTEDLETLNETREMPSNSLKTLEIRLDYPKRIVRGGTIEIKATVLNLDALRAENVVLQWSIPTGFSLISGNERHFCGKMEPSSSCTSEINLKTDMSTVLGTNKIKAVVSYE